MIYSAVTVLQKSIMFFLLPLYTLYLSPSDYGILNIVTSVSSFASIFIIFSLNGAASRFYYKNKDPDYAKKLWGSIVSLVVINSVIFGVIFISLHQYLVDPFVGDISFYPYILLGLVNVILSPLYLFFQNYLQTVQKGAYFGLNTLINFILNIALAVIFLTVFELGVVGVLLANVIVSLVFFIYVFIVFVPKIKLGLDKEVLKPALKYSAPLVPHSLSAWSNGMIDKLFLNSMVGNAATGIYSVGQQFGGIIGIVATSVNRAYVPWFFEKESEGKISTINKMAEVITLFFCFIAFGVTLFSKEIVYIMVSKEYHEVWKIVPIISFAYVFQSMYYIYVNVLFLKHTSLVFIITLVSAAINIILNIIFIPQWGIVGSSFAFFISYFCKCAISLILSMIKNPLFKFPWFKMYGMTFLFLILSLLIFIPVEVGLLGIIFIKVLFCIIIFAILCFIKKDDLRLIFAFTKKVKMK